MRLRKRIGTAFAGFNEKLGYRRLVDFGVIHEGPLRHCHCAVSLALEQWPGETAAIRLTVVHSRRAGFRRERFLAWPYGRGDSRALQTVQQDFAAVEACLFDRSRAKRRSTIGRWFDRVLKIEPLGEHRFVSPIDHQPPSTIDTRLSREDGSPVVEMTQHRKGYGITIVQMPLEAVTAVRAALQRHAYGAR